MRKLQKKSTRITFLLAAALLCAMLVVVLLAVVNYQQMRILTSEDTRNYIREISRQAVDSVQKRVTRNLSGIEATSNMLKYLNLADGGFDAAKARKILEEDSELFGYERYMVFDADGKLLVQTDSNEDEIDMQLSEHDWSSEPYYQKAFTGVSNVRIIDYTKQDGTGSLVYAVPLRKEAEIFGVVLAIANKAQMREFLNLNLYGGLGDAHVIDSKGNFLVLSATHTLVTDTENLIDYFKAHAVMQQESALIDIAKSLAGKRTYEFFYRLEDGVDKVAIMSPVTVDGGETWNLFCIMPTSVTTGSLDKLLTMTLAISLSVVGLFILLAAYIFVLQIRSHRKLYKMAYCDPITGGMNASRFETETRDILKKNVPGKYCMVSMDVDKFKLINDLFGSENGNRTLRYIYDKLVENLSDGELAARISADKFGLLLRFDGKSQILRRMENLIEGINGFNKTSQTKYYLSFSVGVYVVDEPKLDNISIQDRANVARKNFRENTAGKLTNAIFFSEKEREILQTEKDIENRMELALKDREFVVYYQPKYELKTGTISGAEALVRWRDPVRGLIAPAQFIPFFEKNGFITKLDLYVFDEVCRTIQDWRSRGYSMPVSVNVSRVHLSNPEFLQEYSEIFNRYDIPPSDIELELTETLIFENMSLLVDIASEIHRIGFLCSLDDFGSGYSSLNMLKDISVDTLKLDRVFFNSLRSEDDRAESIIESIIQLAKKLKMKTVSEGIESEQQLELLRRVKCDLVQGFVFSKPLPLASFEELAFHGGKKDEGNE